MLFLHGFAGSARNWRPQIRALGRPLPHASPTTRGATRGARRRTTPAAYGAEALVGDALRVLAEAGEARAVWVGLSMGAAVALEAALRAPERGARPRARVDPGGPRRRARHLGARRGVRRGDRARGRRGGGRALRLGTGLGARRRGAALVRQGFLEHPAHGARAHAARLPRGLAAGRASGAPSSRGSRVPALVVAGASTRRASAARRGAGRGRFPDARLEVVPEGAGHVVNLARPDAFDALLALVPRARPRRGRLRAVDLDLSPDEARFQSELRAWLRANVPARGARRPARGRRRRARSRRMKAWQRKLHGAGYVAIGWPARVRRPRRRR